MTQTRQEVERRALALLEQRLDLETRVPDKDWAALLSSETPEVRHRYAELTSRSNTADFAIQTQDGLDHSARPPPVQVGPFRLVSRIGEGGMGQVWLGQRQDGLFDQQVAIKLIHEDRFSERARDRFDAERRILARLEHPGIARLIDGGVSEDGQPWLAMEYVEGQAIDTYLATVQPDLKARVRLMLQVCAVVQAAHARLVVHADLKPANILVDRSGRVRLLDFGISRLVGEDDLSVGPLPLTRAYSSPQRLKGEAPTVSDDIYGLGLLLRDLLGELDEPDLTAIVVRAISETEQDRYGSADALATDLERWLDLLPVSALPDTRAYRTRLFLKRHRRGALMTATALVLLSLSTLFASLSYVRAETARREATQRFDQVRTMARFMIFDLYDQLTDAPGTVTARRNIAAVSGQYLDGLSRTPNASIDLRVETARGYNRLATVQGISGTANLGQIRQARRSLDASERLLRQALDTNPRHAAALEEMGWLTANRWTIAGADDASARLLPEARRWYQAALQSDPGRVGATLGYLINEKNLAFDLIWKDRPKEALPVLKTALAKLDRFAWPADRQEDSQLLKVNLLNRYGDAVYYTGDIAGSETYYRQADVIARAWLKRTPQSLVWNHRRGEILWNLGGVLGELGRHEEALQVLGTGVATLEKVAAYGPDASVEKMLVILLGQKAETLMQLGRAGEAIPPAKRSLDIRRARLSSEPADQARQRDVPVALMPYARVLAAAGDRAGACRAAREAVRGWQALQHTGQLYRLDVRRNLPEAEALALAFCR